MVINESLNSIPTILICSCDRTTDIAFHMVSSLLKYTEIDDFSIYIGCDLSDKFHQLKFIETPPENWKSETLFQLKRIKELHPENPFVLLLLDDFVLNKKVESGILKKIQNKISENDIKCLVLKPTHENFFLQIKNRSLSKELDSGIKFFPVRRNHPYYFSLQSAFWNIDYLIQSIEQSKNIWDFETMKYRGIQHFSLLNSILSYTHIVEKGKWDFNAKKYCEKYLGFFYPGHREFRRPDYLTVCKYYLSKYIVFPLFGYLFLRLRITIKKK